MNLDLNRKKIAMSKPEFFPKTRPQLQLKLEI